MSRFVCFVLVALFVPTLLAHNTPISHATAHATHGGQLTSPDSAIGCDICKGVASIIGPLVRSNVSMDVIEAIATGVCELLKIDCDDPAECKDVCVGIIKEHAPEIIQILTDTLLAPAEVCYIITLCPAPTPPPPPRPGVPVPSNCSDHTGEIHWPAWSLHGKGTFLHLSDIHLDLKYTPGTNSECGEPLCCRAVNGPGNGTTAAGEWGNYQCDTPMNVLQDLLKYIANMNPQPDFIIYTGDDPAHDVWEQSRTNNLASVHAIFGAVAQALPNIPVFPAIGNHEAFPVNQFQGPGGDSWLYDSLVVAWAHWLPEDALHTLQYGGYYTARIRPGLRVVAINTNMYITNNFWLYQNHTDISSQLAWLDDVLSQASALKEQVILIGHQFDGTWFDDFALSYNAIIEKWQSIVVGQFFGHTHTASLGLWYTNSSNIKTPAGVSYIGGGVTTYQDLNPGYNQYGYTRELTNPEVLVETWDMYWSDVTLANANNHPSWNVLGFSAIRDLEMKDLSLTSWQQLGQTFRANNASQTVYEAWVNMYVKGAIGINKLPTQVSIGCDILTTTKAQQELCEQEFQGFVSEKPKDKC